MALEQIAECDIFFLDRDGTLTLGETIVDGANTFLSTLQDQGKQFYVLTNNSSKTPRQHAATFNRKGLDVDAEHVLVSTMPAIQHLKQEELTDVYWVANTAVSTYLENKGLTYTEENPDAALLTYDTELTYDKLVQLTRHVRSNVPYFATHPDIVCPHPSGDLPDVGTFIKLVEMTTGETPDKVFGKPDPACITPVLDQHGFDFSDAAIIGDRLYTDMMLADGSDMLSVLVFSGEATPATYRDSDVTVDYTVGTVADLLPVLQ